MDITDVHKFASRKRMSEDVEKLREKVSRENKKIIKLKVSQDTAYWDLKEQLRQVETNHEKLQQNMVELQMQFETVSGQYQDELRLRPETLNKLGSTREICSVLEEYSERLRGTLSRSQKDQGALQDAFRQSAGLVRELKAKQAQAEIGSKREIEGLRDKLKTAEEHQTQLQQFFTADKQRADTELVEVKSQLGEALMRKEELVGAGRELKSQLDQCQRDLRQKEEDVAALQRDIKQLLQEFNSQAGEMKNTLHRQEKDLKEATASNESLKQALANQESFTKTICEQNNQLLEKIAALEDDHVADGKLVEDLQTRLQIASQNNENKTNEIAALIEKEDNLRNELNVKIQLLSTKEAELQALKSQLLELEDEKSSLAAALDQLTLEAGGLADTVQQLKAAGEDLEKKLEEIGDVLKETREASEKQRQELTSTIKAKDNELDSKASTISQLMSEVRNLTEAKSKVEGCLERARGEAEAERQAARERERVVAGKVEQLEAVVRSKEDELSKQMNVILELRNDKERLQEKISSMQGKIDNIQKELTGPSTREPRLQPDQDDNAVCLTPGNKKHGVNDKCEFAVPRSEPKPTDLMFNFLSDSSLDGDNTLDPIEVNRRFEALSRGERLPRVPLAALKRHRAPIPFAQGGLRPKQAHGEAGISLSQVKEDIKNKERSFFKSKRQDSKIKKAKQFQ